MGSVQGGKFWFGRINTKVRSSKFTTKVKTSISGNMFFEQISLKLNYMDTRKEYTTHNPNAAF